MYDNGQGVPQDYKKAFKWISLPAEKGDAKAQFFLGSMYEDGQGVAQDYTEAIKWYTLAAKQGDTMAQCNLGHLYSNEQTGKKDFDAFLELFSLIEHLKEISKIAKKSLRPSRRNSGIMKNKKAMVFYEPLGIAGIISPWNYPLTTPLTSSVEALLAGNNVILKPSEHTPLTIIYIKELWDEHIGFNQAFEIIFGGGDVGEILVESKDIDVICFTGSSKVGKIIAQKCSLTLKPFILELGGKDPLIVL